MSGKAAFRVGGDEVVLADVCAPLSSLTIPLLELVLITGVASMAIGRLEGRRVAVLGGRAHYYETGRADAMRLPLELLRAHAVERDR